MPVMAGIFLACLALAWVYSMSVSNSRRNEGAEILAQLRQRGLSSFVAAQQPYVGAENPQWFIRSEAVRRGRMITWETTGYHAAMVMDYGNGTVGGVDVILEPSGGGSYEGYWSRWRLNEDASVGE